MSKRKKSISLVDTQSQLPIQSSSSLLLLEKELVTSQQALVPTRVSTRFNKGQHVTRYNELPLKKQVHLMSECSDVSNPSMHAAISQLSSPNDQFMVNMTIRMAKKKHPELAAAAITAECQQMLD